MEYDQKTSFIVVDRYQNREGQAVIDLSPLKKIANEMQGPVKPVLESMPSQMPEDRFIENFAMLWNLSKREVKK